MVATIGLALGFTGATATVVGAGVLAAGAYGVAQTVKSAQKQKEIIRAQEKAQQLRLKRERRQAIRSHIVGMARARARMQASGVSLSSAQAGGLGSGISQLGSEFGTGTQMSGLSGQISTLQGQKATADMRANLAFSGVKFATSAGGKEFMQGAHDGLAKALIPDNLGVVKI
jgi:hypothetical protein